MWDLGIDQIKIYEFNHTTGKFKLYDIIRSQLESAPRQMTFSPDGRFAYVVCELKNYINVLNHVLVFFNMGTDFFICSQLISDNCPILNLTAILLFVKLGCA